MKKILLLCSLLMISPTLMAEDSTTETCANGAGTIITGAVTGTKYCMSNTDMNWWNAVSWCDGLNKKLFDITDCKCSDTLVDCKQGEAIICPELTKPEASNSIWAINTHSKEHGSSVILSSGQIGLTWYSNQRTQANKYPLCK